MKMNRRQMQTLARFPRATKVWRRSGVQLSRGDRVVVRGGSVRLVRRTAKQ